MNTIQTPIALLSFFREERILEMVMLEDAEMNLINTREHYRMIEEITEGKNYMALIDSTHYFSIDSDSFLFASSPEAIRNRIASAHYASAFANRLNTNFFKNRYKPSIPIQLFDSRDEAVSWLRSFPLNIAGFQSPSSQKDEQS